ncbi:MAG: helix-turn-helix domain-containing protein [Bellilinea sp.]
MLKLPEVARVLRISRTTAYSLAAEGVIPSIRIGGSVRVLRSELDALLARSGVNTAPAGNGQGDNR